MHPDPRSYPWSEPAVTGLLTTTGLDEGPTADTAGLVPVAAVGSNASPTVLRAKLGGLLDRGLPLAPATVDGLTVGHSAHVSPGGYVAAAPARGESAGPVTVAWFDPDQLARMDATEPNYRRVGLPAEMACRLDREEETATVVPDVQVYASVHGVVGERGRPLPLVGQASVLDWIGRRLVGLGSRLTHERLREAALRERVRAGLADAGLVVRAGLDRHEQGRATCRCS